MLGAALRAAPKRKIPSTKEFWNKPAERDST